MRFALLLLMMLTGCSIHVRNCICTRQDPDRYRCVCLEHQASAPPCPVENKHDPRSLHPSADVPVRH
jgi:hypothetical protein